MWLTSADPPGVDSVGVIVEAVTAEIHALEVALGQGFRVVERPEDIDA